MIGSATGSGIGSGSAGSAGTNFSSGAAVAVATPAASKPKKWRLRMGCTGCTGCDDAYQAAWIPSCESGNWPMPQSLLQVLLALARSLPRLKGLSRRLQAAAQTSSAALRLRPQHRLRLAKESGDDSFRCNRAVALRLVNKFVEFNRHVIGVFDSEQPIERHRQSLLSEYATG